MVAVVRGAAGVNRMLNYNEKKVGAGQARCLGCGNYPLDADDMTFSMKLNGILKRHELSPTTRYNSLHVSLNFHPSETAMTDEKMMEIAEDYMQRLGFGEQPFLVYRHFDAGHPHLHIVTTNIKADGTGISMHKLAGRCSEPARKEIERIYDLRRAEGQQNATQYRPEPLGAAVANYGRTETKAAIQKVLTHVIDTYKYSSLHELNAVLSQYNVRADRGTEESRVYKRGGLLMKVLDSDGKPVGVPIKASLFYPPPTLGRLEKKFLRGARARAPFRSNISSAVDRLLMVPGTDLPKLIEGLAAVGIAVVVRTNEQGRNYGLTYIDHTTECVFNGSTLGKAYSAAGLQQRCDASAAKIQLHPTIGQKVSGQGNTSGLLSAMADATTNMLDELTGQEGDFSYVHKQFRRKKKRKRKSQ